MYISKYPNDIDYPTSSSSKVNVLVETKLCSSCSSKVTPHNIQHGEKRFNSWFSRVICDCWCTSVCQSFANRQTSIVIAGLYLQRFICRKSCKTHVLLFVVIFCACDPRDINKNITYIFFLNCIYELNFAFKIFQLSYIVRSLKMFGLFTDNY